MENILSETDGDYKISELDRISYEKKTHWLGYHSATIMKLDDGSILVRYCHNNNHFLHSGSFSFILTDDENNCVLDILKHLKNDSPINFLGSEECTWEDYLVCILTLYRNGAVKETGNQEVVEKLDELIGGLIDKREELLSHIEERFVQCIRFKDTFIKYDAICQKYLLIYNQKEDYEFVIISKEEITKILSILFDDSILPHENDRKWVCNINDSFSIYCNSALYEKILLALNEISGKVQEIICGMAELNRKIMNRSKIPIIVLANKHKNAGLFLTTDGYVYKIRFKEQWNQENCLNIISYALETGVYSLIKKWNQKWLDFLNYHLKAVLNWDTYNECYDYEQTYRVFYNLNGNLVQVGIYEFLDDWTKIRLQKIPNDKHCLGIITGMQENHSLFWD